MTSWDIHSATARQKVQREKCGLGRCHTTYEREALSLAKRGPLCYSQVCLSERGCLGATWPGTPASLPRKAVGRPPELFRSLCSAPRPATKHSQRCLKYLLGRATPPPPRVPLPLPVSLERTPEESREREWLRSDKRGQLLEAVAHPGQPQAPSPLGTLPRHPCPSFVHGVIPTCVSLSLSRKFYFHLTFQITLGRGVSLF